MPVIPKSVYKPPFGLSFRHIQTMWPTLIRNLPEPNYVRERVTTPDDDFIDLDWRRHENKPPKRRLLLLSHGLEGNAARVYMAGMGNAFFDEGWDILARNFRGCSGEINRQIRYYHTGETEDLGIVLNHVYEKDQYDEIVLIGFSAGGNQTVKYLCEQGNQVDSRIKGAVAFSVPCDLTDSSVVLEKFENKIYMIRFLRDLHEKIKAKNKLFPDFFDLTDYDQIKTFGQFDDRYTAPMHGFKDARDYWKQASSRPLLKDLRVPVLMVNALDDSFLAGGCYPYDEAKSSNYLYLETPKHGGHVGFLSFNKEGLYWSEKRAIEFVNKTILSEALTA